MYTLNPDRLEQRFRNASWIAGLLTALVGAVVLGGWAADIHLLKSVLTGTVTMKANTALGFLLLGSALCLLQNRTGRLRGGMFLGLLFSMIVLAIGALTLAEYLFEVSFGIDEMLFREDAAAISTSHPGRMAPISALNFLLLGAALLLSKFSLPKRFWPSEYLAVAAFLVAMFPFIGYLYGVSSLVSYTNRYTAMALHTSVAFMFAGTGVLFARPDRGWMQLATEAGAAGVMMRWLLPLTVVVLLLLGWLRLIGEAIGLYASEFGTSLFVVIRVVLMGVIIAGTAKLVQRLERTRDAARHELERANALLEQRVIERTREIEAAQGEVKRQRDFMAKITDRGGTLILLIDRDGKIIQFNRACEETTGYKADELQNRIFWEVFFSPLYTTKPMELFQNLFDCGMSLQQETAWITKSGAVRWINWYGTGLEEKSGAISHCVIAGVDVTERRRAEELLRQSEQQLQDILDHLPVGVILSKGLEQTMLYQNPRFVEMFGYTIEDFPNVKTWWPLAYPEPEYRALMAAQWERHISEASLLQTDIKPIEAAITARDGSRKYVSIHATVIGQLNVVTFVDMTAYRCEEKARHLDEMRLEALLKLNQMSRAPLKELTDFVLEEAIRLTKSAIGYLAFMNEDETELTMHSWSHAAMEQCAIQEKPLVYPVKETGLWGEAVRKRGPVITNDYAAPNPLKKGCPEGHVPIFRHMNIPVMDDSRIVAVAGVGNKEEPYDDSDVRQLTLLMEGMWRILQRRQDEIAIKQMRAYLQNVVDSMPSVLVGVNLEGAVTHWNQEAVHMTGLTVEQTRGRDLGDVLPQLQGQLEKVLSAVGEGRPLENERFSFHAAEEDTRYYDLRVFPLIANGAKGAVVRLDDVTTRVQIEEMMVQTEKMMSVGGLAAGMAHEINNPLGGILQACQNIERRTASEFSKNVEAAQAIGVDLDLVRRYLQDRRILEFVAGIRADGMRAARIVADMLSFSRRSESLFAPTKLSDMVETVLRLAANDYDLKKQYDFRNIRIDRDFQPDMPAVPCEKIKIEQVLLNLIKNAAQAMARQDTAVLPVITIRLSREPHHARIEILDNGPGMQESVRRRVFEPFFTTKEVGVGTGLGLSVSYFIITRQHKGTMAVESTPGGGARFIIRLPLQMEG